ncbi:MAG: Type 4 prepilin-like protein leader peptide-processing enzyme [Parcubacteria group bacterium GW2011_GWA2_47_9]|uniref:Prepilin peptidase n=1 Tax=Candidatus Wildermuthbacteria bacterium RIFCSPHIGHO2_02_FULL_47_17 TaxID=1802452 RepID=A0A1G2R471_9BACT|nr:MAG: Type 4 prepilin-like protein leader peptide-processing enzyme [Parcubacteria group bacterium GW2011_GWA2_47_9]OHA67527.1 MAG: hypothetical protein A3D59_03870 [Candidatus Wildermuthbacteria bacterium RIFCSPHIGHO2_02_FULL_47_17]
MVPDLFFSPFIFLLGLAIGSFLNAVIHRLQTEEKLFPGRSHCPHCRHKLAAKDLIPLISYLLLKGRCRYCKKPISLQYPLVELATGLLFVAVLQYTAPLFIFNPAVIFQSPLVFFVGTGTFLYYLLLISFLTVIFVYDLKHHIIPDKIIYPAIVLAALFRLFQSATIKWHQDFDLWDMGSGAAHFLTNPFFAGLGAALFFYAIFAFSRGKWMGFGDVKLALLMGLVLGFPLVLVALFTAFLTGAAMGLGLVLLKQKNMKSEVPFGPFLVAGTFIALFWGQQIIDWYWHLLW